MVSGPTERTNTAYWGPPVRVGPPQRALSVDLGAETNVRQISFRSDGLAPTQVVGRIQDRQTNKTVPVRSVGSTRPPLAAEPDSQVNLPNVRTTLYRDSGLTTTQAQARAQGAAEASNDSLTATGTLDALRYGRPAHCPRRGRLAWCGLPARRPLLRQTGHPHHPARRVHPGLHAYSGGCRRDDSGGAAMSDTYYGKYRGQVADNIDPYKLGRVQVTCPAVLGEGRASWAMPSTPYAGNRVGFFAVPPIGANVWVEFEAGNLDYPIWSGCFWGNGEVPTSTPVATTKVFKTDGLTLTVDDTPGSGGVKLEVSPPVVAMTLRIQLSSSAIELSAGAAKIKLGPATVSLNDGALEVI